MTGDEAIVGPSALKGVARSLSEFLWRAPIAAYTGKSEILLAPSPIMEAQERWRTAGYGIQKTPTPKLKSHSFDEENFTWGMQYINGQRR